VCHRWGGGAAQQDFSGAVLVRAPKWSVSVGATYEMKDSLGNIIGFSADANRTSGFFTDAINTPGGYQTGCWLLDGSVRYQFAKGLEFAFIGRNLTNKYYFQRSAGTILTGGASGGVTGVRADQTAYVSRGRELALRISYHFK
jgi:iron complex outermembrane recepter protein